MLNRIIFFSLLFLPAFIVVPKVSATEVEFFDSTNHYLGACQLTDKSAWELTEDVQVTKFQVWYNWSQGETTLPVQVFKDGEKFAEFTATRASCDPYQQLWCNADYAINKLFPKGKYTTVIPNAKQCLKPGGTGAIRLYKEGGVTPSPSATLSPSATQSPPPPASLAPTPTPTSISSCNCKQTTIIVSAVAASTLTSLLVSLLLKKLL
ncbi:MAG: hypothetical protein V1487_01795 [bacterium]